MEEWDVTATIFLSEDNESVEEIWPEKKVFSCNDDIKEIYHWASKVTSNDVNKKKIRISIS